MRPRSITILSSGADWWQVPGVDRMAAMAARKPHGDLRKGWTTGACAAAATRAAAEALLTGHFPDPVSIRLPKGGRAVFGLTRCRLANGSATAGVVKDAGDDPDVTNGALVLATVEPGVSGAGVTFAAGEGVGTVTLPGLPLAVGEPAITDGPRAMMRAAVADVASEYGAASDLRVTISVPDGRALAARTSNPRLGIKDGISILGTTGIVIPYSCSSWIHSIHRGIDVARAAGIDHVAASTGRTSEATVQRLYGLADTALIDMGDFVGGTLKYLRRHPIPRLTLAGGFGKVSKLAAGHMDLHSERSQVDVAGLADMLASLGADAATVAAARRATGAGGVLALAREAGLPLADRVAAQARAAVLAALAGGTDVDVVVIDRSGEVAGRAGP